MIIVAFLLALSAGCSNNIQKSSNIFSKVSTYKNDSFGITIQIPDNWHIQTREDKNMEAAFKDSKHNTVNLLTISKYPYESDQQNAEFNSVVEKGRIKNGKNYLINMKRLLENDDNRKYLFEKDIYTKKIDGIDFAVLECKLKSLPNEDSYIYQTLYAAIIKDYTYCFILTSAIKEDSNTLNEIINSVKFGK